MISQYKCPVNDFCLVGINYKNTDVAARGIFSIGAERYKDILKLAPLYGVQNMFVLSTCNRTEIYGLTEDPAYLMMLLKGNTTGDNVLLEERAYVKNGIDAVSHLYNVGCGLDSQILGDYEIVSQLKYGVNFARAADFLGSFLDRMVSSVLRSSKKVRTDTKLSSGSVSVAFSAVRYIQEKIETTSKSRLLIVGAGKIGRNICKNLLNYYEANRITVINRSLAKAIKLSEELGINYAAAESLVQEINRADIILLATNSPVPVLFKSHLDHAGKKTVIDLSMPSNVDAEVRDIAAVELVLVDQVSKLKDDNLLIRAAEIPKARKIIELEMYEFLQWNEKRKRMAGLPFVKSKLNSKVVFS